MDIRVGIALAAVALVLLAREAWREAQYERRAEQNRRLAQAELHRRARAAAQRASERARREREERFQRMAKLLGELAPTAAEIAALPEVEPNRRLAL